MTSLFYKSINAISMLVLVGTLAACTSTSSRQSSGESRTSEISSQTDDAAVTPSQVVSPADAVESSLEQESETMETSPPAQQSEEIADGAVTGSAGTVDTVEGIAEFPEQRYEIEDSSALPEDSSTLEDSMTFEDSSALEDSMTFEDSSALDDSMAYEDSPPLEDSITFEDSPALEDSLSSDESADMQSEADSDIDRLRDELAASELELERIRAEEAERDFATNLARSASSDGSDTGSAVGEQSTRNQSPTTTAQAAQVPVEGARARASDLPDKPAEYSIYFAYNQAALENGVESVIGKHALFLKQNPDLVVEIQGNCDERGSREYNIALGERRARTVKRALELLGVDGSRIGTVSFGAEKPIAFGRDEESYRLNRRADIVY